MVKQGYKQTEIGVIPDGWEIKHIDNLCEIMSGGTPNTKHSDYWGGNIAWCTPTDITRDNQKYIYRTERYITEKGLKNSSACLMPPNSILLCSRATIGELKINVIPMATNQGFKNLKPNDSCDVDYLYYLLQTKKSQMIEKAIGSTFLEISKKALCEIDLLCPPLPEQKAIAEALSDVDRLIESLEKLIEKKKAIKQGAMQQLLTGKKRLNGFTSKWDETTLGKVCEIYRGGSPRPIQSFLTNSADGVNWIKIGDVDEAAKYINSTKEKIVPEGTVYSRKVYKGDLILSNSMSFGRPYILNLDGCIHDGWLVIQKYQDTYTLSFLYYFLCSEETMAQYIAMAAGSSVQNLNKDKVAGIKVPIMPKEEQTAIANILTDMDAEIEALQKKLAKVRLIKQGMMQELLTGRIRLVDTEEKAPPQAAPVIVVKKEQSRQGHNKYFEDAVLIAAIVDAFYSDKYPLGRVKIQKLLYLLRRKQEASVAEFKKKAAGPYADEVRYKGGEPIAKTNKYIVTSTSEKGTRYGKGEYITQALGYIEKWNMQADINWLKNNFLHTSRNELELLATIDMAMCDLTAQGKEISIANIKELIRSDKEWNAKLKKAYFSDIDIQRAIKENERLFG